MKITTVAKVANKRFKENSETITLNVDISFEYDKSNSNLRAIINDAINEVVKKYNNNNNLINFLKNYIEEIPFEFKKSPSKNYPVYQMEWIEKERGWGQRYFGSTTHLTEKDAHEYANEYWETEKRKGLNFVPDVYIFPNEDRLKIISIDEYEYNKLVNLKDKGILGNNH